MPSDLPFRLPTLPLVAAFLLEAVGNVPTQPSPAQQLSVCSPGHAYPMSTPSTTRCGLFLRAGSPSCTTTRLASVRLDVRRVPGNPIIGGSYRRRAGIPKRLGYI